MVQKFLEHATTEWEALKTVPIAVAFLVAIAFLVAYAIVRWFYTAKLGAVRERLAGIGERLAAKDRQLAEYRGRLHVTASDRVSYSGLSDADLKESALGWVRELREYLVVGEVEAQTASFEQFTATAIVLRDELLSRLPPHARDDRWFSFYEHASDAVVSVVADDLERLAGDLAA
ncbi:MAG: hypothetical protein HYS33_06950 [Acidobacteria bacterium]|nr:hypothetical protein [Acidobacteriota bacterium]